MKSIKECKNKKDREMQQNFEQRVRDALTESCREISASGQLKCRIDKAISFKEEKTMRKISIRKVAVGVAAACLLVSGVAFAGHTAYITSGVPSMPEYETYGQIGEAEDRLGYPADHVESFSNGYTFAGASIGINYAHDENDNKLYSYQEMVIDYRKAGEPGLSLTVEKTVESISNTTTPDAARTCGDITIEYRENPYKFVKTDYVLTEKDKEAMENGDITISIGADKEELQTCYSVEWNKDGIHYYLSGFDVSLSAGEMMDMAEEIIKAE